MKKYLWKHWCHDLFIMAKFANLMTNCTLAKSTQIFTNSNETSLYFSVLHCLISFLYLSHLQVRKMSMGPFARSRKREETNCPLKGGLSLPFSRRGFKLGYGLGSKKIKEKEGEWIEIGLIQVEEGEAATFMGHEKRGTFGEKIVKKAAVNAINLLDCSIRMFYCWYLITFLNTFLTKMSYFLNFTLVILVQCWKYGMNTS